MFESVSVTGHRISHAGTSNHLKHPLTNTKHALLVLFILRQRLVDLMIKYHRGSSRVRTNNADGSYEEDVRRTNGESYDFDRVSADSHEQQNARSQEWRALALRQVRNATQAAHVFAHSCSGLKLTRTLITLFISRSIFRTARPPTIDRPRRRFAGSKHYDLVGRGAVARTQAKDFSRDPCLDMEQLATVSAP